VRVNGWPSGSPRGDLSQRTDLLFAILVVLNVEIAAADRCIAELTMADLIATLLTTASGSGPITTSTLVATIDDITRFRSAHEFEAYLGMVPGERNSGEKH